MRPPKRLPIHVAIQGAFSLGLFASQGLALAADAGTNDLQAPVVEVVGTTPLPGLGVPKDSVPGNVQTATDKDLRTSGGGVTPPQFMERGLDSVNVNESQGNMYQPDVNYRGFTASPITGTPGGLSVFQDGVRINEPFGDNVNWDLLPKSAIAGITLMPGSNPVFGLNTLGGALAITTKDGFDYPGFVGEVYGGSWDRRAADFEFGGHGDNTAYFVTANSFDDHGWRDATSTQVRQAFGKFSFRDSDTDLHLSFTGADNTLFGGQTIPLSFYNQSAKIAYTPQDNFVNQLAFINLDGKHYLSDASVVSGNIYYRTFRSRNFSTNTNDDFDTTQPASLANPQATNVEDDVTTNGYGGGTQYAYHGNIGNMENRLSVGAGVDAAGTDFTELDLPANYATDRTNISLGPATLDTQAHINNFYYGVYITDTLSPTKWLDITASGRYNRAEVKIEDLTGTNPALNGKNTFNRFNPAAGLTFKPSSQMTAYANYSEGMRIPTPVELTCADPNAPCSLPNNFLADPPLQPVIARTIEAGLRGRVSNNLRWHATAYQTNLENDILFVSASTGSANSGFFQNVGTTRRRGLELGFDGKADRVTYSASYALIDATFRTPFSESSPSNPSADGNGNIQVNSGDKIPGIPRQILKLRGDYLFVSSFNAGVSMYGATRQYARADENNDPSGNVPGYAIFNLDAHWRFSRGWEMFGEVDNLFDKKYASLGVMGTNFFSGPNKSFDAANAPNELFVAPGAPIGVWVGVRYTFGRKDSEL
jgi:outer membrane receptor protein involved in Fe transport